MKITKYRYRAVVIAKDLSFGNALGKAVSPWWHQEGADEAVFEDGVKLSNGARAAVFPATGEFVAVLDALSEGAPIDDPRIAYLVQSGRLDASTWEAAKAQFLATYWLAWQDDGTFVDSPGLVQDFAQANGYTVVPE